MASRSRFLQAVLGVVTAISAGCIQSPSLTDGQVYVGRPAAGVNYQPFRNTSGANVTPDATVCFPDTSIYCPDAGGTLRVVVPGPGDPENAFAGGTLLSDLPRNLSGYDAVTFWAKSTRGAPVVIGLGADQTESPAYLAEGGAWLTTEWTQYILPIPLPSRLTAERGLFYFSAGADGSPATGFTFWLANIQFVTVGTAIGGPRPVLPAACVKRTVGDGAFPAFPYGNAIPVAFDVNARVEVIAASNRYFTFTSSDPAVATVDPGGRVAVQGNGVATVTAQLGGVPAAGPLTVKVGGAETCPPLAVPTDIAPTPNVPAADVISMFGSAYAPYTSVPLNWQTSWSLCCSDYAQVTIPGPSGPHVVKKYGLHPFVGVEFIETPPPSSVNLRIDASAMNWFHVDVWTPDGFDFGVRLVNDPGGFQSESTVGYYVGTGTWTSLEIPMTDFRNLGGTSKLGQLLFLVPDGTSATFYVDNVYFHK